MNATTEAIIQLYSRYRDRYVSQIVEIFQDYFGEEFVDHQVEKYDAEDCRPYAFQAFIKTLIRQVYGRQIFMHNYAIPELDNYFQDNPIDVSLLQDEEHIFDNLDMEIGDQKCENTITIWFPKVQITNEHKEATIIKDLYVKVWLTPNGGTRKDFEFMTGLCATLSYAHFVNRYLHSHLPSLGYKVEEFHNFCKGTGPIGDTASILSRGFDEDQWKQFCWDLDKYVTVESEKGGPYKHLNTCSAPYVIDGDLLIQLQQGRYFGRSSSTSRAFLKSYKNYIDFVKYLIENKILKFAWNPTNGWTIAETPSDYAVTISNAFFRYIADKLEELEISDTVLNTNLSNYNYFQPVIINIKSIYGRSQGNPYNLSEYQGKLCLNFKGNPVYFKVEEIPEESSRTQTILCIRDISFITDVILRTLNIKYGRE